MRRETDSLFGSAVTDGILAFSRMNAINKSNEVRKVSKIVEENHVTLLYFSAPDSEQCSEFLTKLKRVYNKAKQLQKPMEIVYIPCGSDLTKKEDYVEDFKNNHGDWWAMDSTATGSYEMKYMFDVTYIPMVVVIDSTAYVITANGRQKIETLGDNVLDKWFLSNTGSISSYKVANK